MLSATTVSCSARHLDCEEALNHILTGSESRYEINIETRCKTGDVEGDVERGLEAGGGGRVYNNFI